MSKRFFFFFLSFLSKVTGVVLQVFSHLIQMSNDRVDLAKSSQALEVVAEAAEQLSREPKGRFTPKTIALILLMVINLAQVFMILVPVSPLQPSNGSCLSLCVNQTTQILYQISVLAAALTASRTSECTSNLSQAVFS